MPIGDAPMTFDRRALLRGAILLVGGVAVAPEVWAQAERAFFTAPERATLDLLCETMIPRTDTPGAIEAGVPTFLDTLMVSWASPASQTLFRDLVARLAESAKKDTGKPIAALTAPQRTAWLARQDAALLAAWDPGYVAFKQLVLTGYYWSEAGATQELRYELIPGSWEPAIPLTPDTRAWAV